MGEWKYKDTIWGASVVDWDATGSLLNGLGPGTGASERIGMKASFRSIEFRVDSYAGTTGVDCSIRCLIFIDRQSNGADPGPSSAAIIAALLNSGEVRSPRNLANRNRFKILLDKAWTISAVTKDNANKCYKKYARFSKPIVTEYNTGTAGTVADIATNAIFAIFVSTVDPAANPTNKPSVYPYFRLRYQDN